jgi:hypothetical protein
LKWVKIPITLFTQNTYIFFQYCEVFFHKRASAGKQYALYLDDFLSTIIVVLAYLAAEMRTPCLIGLNDYCPIPELFQAPFIKDTNTIQKRIILGS